MRFRFRLLVLLGICAVGVAFASGDSTAAAALGAALVGVFSVVYQQDRQKMIDLEQAHREQMVPFYEGFIDRVREYGDLVAESGGEPNEDIKAFMGDFQTKLLLRAPAPIIDAWITQTRVEPPTEAGDPTAVLAYERLLRAIRKDLGHDDSLMPEGDLLRVFVNDIDEHLPPRGVRWSPGPNG